MNSDWVRWAVKKYLPDILTGAGMAGVAVTGYLSYEAGKKDAATEVDWRHYIPPVVSGAVTMGAVFGAHKAHLHKEAMLAAVAAMWSGKYRDLDRKVKSILGEERYNELRKLIVKEDAEKNGTDNPPWESAEAGKTTYYEPYSKQYFQATPHEMLYAQLHINKVFQEYGGVTMNDYLNVLPGCRRIEHGSEYGWYQGTAVWEELWSYCTQDIGHFIDIEFEEMPNRPDVKIIMYNIAPSIPDDDFEPWK